MLYAILLLSIPLLGAQEKPSQDAAGTARDVYGDPLPSRAVARMGTVRLRHTYGVAHLAFSPDGKTLATSTSRGPVRLWETATGKPLFAIRCARSTIDSIAFSPDGRTLVTGENGSVNHVWNLESRKEIRSMEGATHFLQFSPDGKTLAGAHRSVHVWDTATGKRLHKIDTPDRMQTCSPLSRDGKRGAFWKRDNSVGVWETDTGRTLFATYRFDRKYPPPVLSPGGETLACEKDKTIILWDVDKQKRLRTFEGDNWIISCLAFSPNREDTRRRRSQHPDSPLECGDRGR